MYQPLPTQTLLFVDDEASILSSLRRLFRPHGYNVLTAGGGREGLALMEREAVDLVISDMRMPEMDGAQFLEQVRQRWPQAVRILLTGYADVASTIAAINRGEIFRYVAKPWDDNEIVLIVRDALERKRLEAENARLDALTARQNDELKALNAGLEQKVAERTAELNQTVAFLDQAHQELKKSFLATVRVFSGLIELRGGKLAGHSRRVAEHARQLAQRLGFDDSAVQEVLLAALLHDIGKLGLPDQVLDKPFNSLSAETRAEVMKHPAKGAMVLMGIDQLKGVAPLVHHHHECWDGSGYPDRLAGLALPLGARILAVANDYDALQMGTLVNRSLKPAEALAFIVENRGKRYDPTVVDALAALISESIGSVKSASVELPLRPTQLKPGMVLARDLVHHDGYLLLARSHAVDANIIEQLVGIETSENRPLTLYIRHENG
ncbi:MAG TPA: HD domain-containing phosphohydrolase [Rhodocyclaceae bacterium]|nr:HD domain-containing phosphohydrolase [Rhodocyclaceae bacterium]